MQAEGHAALSLCISNKMEACWALYNGVPPLTFVPQHDGKPQLSQETWCIIYVKLWTEMLFSILYKYIYYSSKHSDWFCQVTVRRNFPAIFKKRTVDAASISSGVRCWFLHAVNHGTNRHGPSPLPVAAWKLHRGLKATHKSLQHGALQEMLVQATWDLLLLPTWSHHCIHSGAKHCQEDKCPELFLILTPKPWFAGN